MQLPKKLLVNPQSNALGPGLTIDQVAGAISKSGYPLQFRVGESLRKWKDESGYEFSVQDEWGFLDRDSKEHRSLDLRANMTLHGWHPQPRVRPQLTLLIECKQTELPYLFFGHDNRFVSLNYPTIAGLRHDSISLRTNDSPSRWNFSVPHALGLNTDCYQAGPFAARTFSKCVRKGSSVELSGTDAYNALTLPLVKAMKHCFDAEKPVETARFFDAHLMIGLAIIDGPMLTVSIEGDGYKTYAQPWVRAIRHEFDASAEHFHQDRQYAFEIVHKDFLEAFLGEHLLPFSRRFAEAVLRHPAELATGRGVAKDLEKDGWQSIEDRMKRDRRVLLPLIDNK